MSDTENIPAADETPKPFTPEQEQYFSKLFQESEQRLSSHFGRIVTKQFEEKLKPELKKEIDPEKLNEELSNKLFGGDVIGTINKIIEDREKTKKETDAAKVKILNEEMDKFKDDELYEDVKDIAETLAKEAMAKGFPPGPAAELGFEKASKQFLKGSTPERRLGMTGGGKPPKQTKTKELPADLKAAADRDIRDGLFKDHAEWAASLSPATRAKHGL